jgi:hypothetical protein
MTPDLHEYSRCSGLSARQPNTRRLGKTAKVLGITMPPSLLATAKDVPI